MKESLPTPTDLLRVICYLGQGEIPEYVLLRELDISHGTFCRLRRILVQQGRLIVTHPRRRAFYFVPDRFVEEAELVA